MAPHEMTSKITLFGSDSTVYLLKGLLILVILPFLQESQSE